MMNKKGIKLFIVLSLFILLSHCISWHREEVPSHKSVAPVNFPDDITSLEEIAKNNPDSSVRAKSHLQLALLYSSYKNPHPHYQQALKELEAYIDLNSSGEVSEEIQNLHAILREMGKITSENQKMKHENRLLRKQNIKLRESVKQLENLDIEMEEKRKKLQ
jgi:hypothetical protein